MENQITVMHKEVESNSDTRWDEMGVHFNKEKQLL